MKKFIIGFLVITSVCFAVYYLWLLAQTEFNGRGYLNAGNATPMSGMLSFELNIFNVRLSCRSMVI